jgi:transcriptional regulator with XRE-family HTH domain
MLSMSSVSFACLICLACRNKEKNMNDNERRKRAEMFGAYLNSLRMGLGFSLRDVEAFTEKKVSNAYLSQLEKGKISGPSPHILHSLAQVYDVDYEKLMERAGYFSPRHPSSSVKKPTLRSHSIENLTAEEEKELLEYLAFWRSKNKEA